MNARRSAGTALTLFILTAWLAGCYLPTARTEPSSLSPEDRVNTAAAMTVSALGTRIAAGENPTLGPATLVPPTRAPEATETPAPTQPAPAPASPTAAQASSTPASDAPCNQAGFVGDVTIPDDSVLPPNTVFTKTWELKNNGSCAWNNTYAVVFAGRGSAMGGPAATPIIAEGEVKPGETVQVSVTMRAPDSPGEYTGYWLLRSGDNQTFGTGQNRSAPFFVKIRVAESYSFAEHWCSARWVAGSGSGENELPCSGQEGGSQGYVLQRENPTLEDNNEREGLGLLVAAPATGGGYIAAHFPPVMVPPQSDFRATVGCQPGASGCYVRFRVTARIDGGSEQVLGEWNEGYEGGLTNAILDLDDMAGRPTAFSLYMTILGSADQGRGIWFDPRIVK